MERGGFVMLEYTRYMNESVNKKKRICVPSFELDVKPQSHEEFQKDAGRRLDLINKEFTQAFGFLKKYPRTVTFFGSARFKPEDKHYKQAERIASRACELGYVVITGGGPGIMEAANKGAKETCDKSIGFNIELPREQVINEYVTENLGFHYFFSRKVALAYAAEAYLFFPGGFGTLDEFFEIITLVQTKKIEKIPIILVGKDFWDSLDEFIVSTLYKDHGSINKEDLDLYSITDDENEIIDILKSAPPREA